jgi:hypothetical protein
MRVFRALAAAGLLVAVGALVGCSGVHGARWVFAAKSSVELQAKDGSCTILQGARGKVRVDVSWTYPIEAGYVPDSLETADGLVFTESLVKALPGRAAWTISVPPGTRVRVSTGGGDVRASQALISLTARSEAGALRLDRVEGVLVLSTGSGAIDVTGFTATGDSAFGSDSGAVGVSLARAPAAGLFLFTDSGSLSLDYGTSPLTGSFHLESRADTGSIASTVPLDSVSTVDRNGERFTVGTLRRGNGEPTIRLLTRTGRVALTIARP